MLSWCSDRFKSTKIKVIFGAAFLLTNVLLYIQSKHFIIDIMFAHVATNQSFISAPAIVNKSGSSGNTTFVLQYNILNNSSKAYNLTAHTEQVRLTSVTTTIEKPFLREQIVNPHDFNYVIKPNVTCSNRDIALVICVPISYNNYKGREVIRQTWGSYAYNASNKALLVFFIGVTRSEPGKSADFTNRNLTNEASQYGDLLQEDFIDSYQNLSLKSVSILKWVSLFCSSARFVLKVDDDMYANIPFLVKVLGKYASNRSNQDAYIIGTMQANARPIRDSSSKWYTPVSLFSGNTYPNYVSGTAYVMTSIAASLLYQASQRVPIFWLEDVYITGICARKASVHMYNSVYFTTGKPVVSGCSFKAHVSGHRYTHQEIIQIHKELYDPNLRC